MRETHGGQHTRSDNGPAIRAKALESLLVEKGLLASDAVDALVEAYKKDIGPMNGSKVVARGWTDPAYKERLLENGTDAIEELGFGGLEGSKIVVLENTDTVHNMVVCTLCSCYPWPVLGLPPNWYKSLSYRARAVSQPRTVLKEIGLEIDESVVVRVWDSTADVRYLVLPQHPDGTEDLSEAQLVELATRDSMIGIAKANFPRLGRLEGLL